MEEQPCGEESCGCTDATRPQTTGDRSQGRRLTIPVKAKSKARPRMSKNGHVYTDKATAQYERYIKQAWIDAHSPCKPFSGPLVVTLSFRYQRPKSHYLRGVLRDTAPVHYVQTPDLDNIEKAVLDALNGVAYVDDKQIIRKFTEKSWAEMPEIEVWIYEMP